MRHHVTTAGRLLQVLAAPAMVLLLNGTGHAQTPPQERYPWDLRPPKCFMEGAAPFGMCSPADNYPSAEQTINNVFALYFNDTFTLLERYLSDLVASGKRFPDGQYPEEIIFRAFTRLMPGSAADGSGLARNTAWRKVAPDSKFVVYAESARLRAAAWNARGTGFANSVSQESWELFAIRLQEAEAALLNASPPIKDSPAWHLSLLAAALDSNRVQSNAQEVFENAVKRWPTYAAFHEFMVERLVPRWGGSWPQVEEFVAKSTSMQPASEGKSLYARLYIYLIRHRSAHGSNMNWEMMKIGFEDTIARFSDSKYKNLYASYACLAKDKDLFNKAMSKMSREEIIPGWWLDGNSYDACFRWAAV